MTIKSPCVDKCKLNSATNLCDGCFRTSEEITNWTSFSSKQKQKVLKLLELRKLKIICFMIFFLFFNNSLANNPWIGKWLALDQWQSEFEIQVNQDGSAITNYGNGDNGTWSIVDGNLEIRWDSGKKDYLFSGVMGYQRLSKDKNNSYTTGLKKSFD